MAEKSEIERAYERLERAVAYWLRYPHDRAARNKLWSAHRNLQSAKEKHAEVAQS